MKTDALTRLTASIAATLILAWPAFSQTPPPPTVIQGTELVSDSRATINTNFANLYSQVIAGQGSVIASNFNFAAQAPGGTLNPGSNSITLRPVPPGVNGTNVNYYMYASGGTGTPESCLVTGGTAVSGAPSGTIIMTCANSHSGQWTVQSASAGIQEAATTIPSGGNVLVQAGTWNIYGQISIIGQGVCVSGVSTFPAVVLNWLGPSTGNIIFEDGPHSPGGVGQGNCLQNLRIIGPATSNTNTGIYINNQAQLNLKNINIDYVNNGIYQTGEITQRGTWDNIVILYNNGDGITFNADNGGNTFLNNIQIACTDVGLTSIGIHILGDAAEDITNTYVTGCGKDALIDPPSGQTARFGNWINVYLDCNPGQGLVINPPPGGIVNDWIFANSASACATQDGVYIGSTGTISQIKFTDYKSVINGHHGFDILGGTNITINGAWSLGNSIASIGVYDGLYAAGNVTSLNITGGQFNGSYYDVGTTQSYGIAIGSGVSNWSVTGNQLSGNANGPLTDSSTTPYRVYANNVGAPTVPTMASAASFDPGPLDPAVIGLTGSTALTSIARGWDQRRITFINTTFSPLTVLNATVPALGSVDCTYVYGYTGWFCN